MDTADNEDSINRIRLVQDTLFGRDMKLTNLNKVQGIIIRLRSNENAVTSRHQLIAMLEELLRKDSAKAKKRKLEDYGLIMNADTERRVNTMCNLSEVLLEKGIEEGREKGRAEGRATTLSEAIMNVMASLMEDNPALSREEAEKQARRLLKIS